MALPRSARRARTTREDSDRGMTLGPPRWMVLARRESERSNFHPSDRLSEQDLASMVRNFDRRRRRVAVIAGREPHQSWRPGAGHWSEELAPAGEVLDLDFDGLSLWGLVASRIDPHWARPLPVIDYLVSLGYEGRSIGFDMAGNEGADGGLVLSHLAILSMGEREGIPNMGAMSEWGWGLEDGALQRVMTEQIERRQTERIPRSWYAATMDIPGGRAAAVRAMGGGVRWWPVAPPAAEDYMRRMRQLAQQLRALVSVTNAQTGQGVELNIEDEAALEAVVEAIVMEAGANSDPVDPADSPDGDEEEEGETAPAGMMSAAPATGRRGEAPANNDQQPAPRQGGNMRTRTSSRQQQPDLAQQISAGIAEALAPVIRSIRGVPEPATPEEQTRQALDRILELQVDMGAIEGGQREAERRTLEGLPLPQLQTLVRSLEATHRRLAEVAAPRDPERVRRLVRTVGARDEAGAEVQMRVPQRVARQFHVLERGSGATDDELGFYAATVRLAGDMSNLPPEQQLQRLRDAGQRLLDTTYAA